MKSEPLAAESGPPVCVELGVEAELGSMESGLPAGRRRRRPQREVWSAAELSAVLVVGCQPWSLLSRLLLLL